MVEDHGVFLCVIENKSCWVLQLIKLCVSLGTIKPNEIMETQMTIREIRRVLFETEKYTVIGAEEMTNKSSRDFLYSKEDQDEVMNVIDNKSHLLIWS